MGMFLSCVKLLVFSRFRNMLTGTCPVTSGSVKIKGKETCIGYCSQKEIFFNQ